MYYIYAIWRLTRKSLETGKRQIAGAVVIAFIILYRQLTDSVSGFLYNDDISIFKK